MKLVRNWTQLQKINTFTFGNNTFLLAQIFDILKTWQNLPIVFQTLKVFMSSALTFTFMTSEFLVFPWAIPCDTNNVPFPANLLQVIWPNRVFVKLSRAKLFLWIRIFNWRQTETSNSSSLLVSYNGILRKEIFLWASDNFFDSLWWKTRFSSNQFYFHKWTQLWQQESQIGRKQKQSLPTATTIA